MNWLFWVIFGIVFIITMIAILSDGLYKSDGVGECILLSILAIIPSSIMAALISVPFYLFSCPGHYDYFKPVENHTVELVQSQVNHKIEGAMGLFYGRIDDRDVYRFYVKDGANGYKLDYIYADNGRIVEIDDTETPYVMYYDKIMYTKTPNWWQRNFFTKRGWEREVTHEAKHVGVLYVPKGTIIQNKFDGMNL